MKAPKHTYNFTIDGIEYKRTTTRTYSHVLVSDGLKSDDPWYRKNDNDTRAMGWVGRPDLVDKAIAQWPRFKNVRAIEIPQSAQRADK